MPMNRIQFQRGMSMPEFQLSFGTEARYAAALELSRWPDGFVCPRCESSAHCVLLGRQHKMFQGKLGSGLSYLLIDTKSNTNPLR